MTPIEPTSKFRNRCRRLRMTAAFLLCIVGCSELTPPIPIRTLLDRAAEYEGRTAKIRGTVSRRTKLFGQAFFFVSDSTGSIMVVPQDGRLPADQRKVTTITGTVSSVAVVAGTALLPHITTPRIQ